MSSSTLLAIRMFCIDWHNGQGCRLYRLQCKIKRVLEKRGYTTYRCLLTTDEQNIYKRLEAKYAK